MKTALIASHQITKDDPIPLYGSLGVLALAASLKKKFIECEVLDLVTYNKVSGKKFSDISNEIAQRILKIQAAIIGFSTISDSLILALEIAERVKVLAPEKITVFGGPGVSYCAQSVLDHFPQVDYIIRGEADEVFPEFIQELSGGQTRPKIKGLVYKSNDQLNDFGWPDPIKNLDDLEIPAYEFCEDSLTVYNNFDKSFGFVIEAGRGCPYNCTFCSTSHYFKRKFRVKSVQRIIEEVKTIKDKVGEKRIILSHDLLTFKKDYMEQLCVALAENFPDRKWGCNSRLDTIDKSLIEKMASCGFSYIYFGIESATEKMQKIIGKRLDLSRFDSILESLKIYKFEFVLSFIVGLPGEDSADIEAMFSMILKSKMICEERCLIQIHPLIPELGSKIMSERKYNLVYDESGSVIDTALPLTWQEQREKIKKFPEIFARFFRLQDNFRDSSVDFFKYSYFSHLAENLIPKSLIYAYKILNDDYSKIIIKCFDEVTILLSKSLEKIDFNYLLEKIHIRTVEALKEKNIAMEIYNALAIYEMTMYKVWYHRAEGYTCTVQLKYSESQIKDLLKNPDNKFIENTGMRNILFFWDKEKNRSMCIEISPEFSRFFQN